MYTRPRQDAYEADRTAAPGQAARSGERGLAVRLQLRGAQSDPVAAIDGSTAGNAPGAVCLNSGYTSRGDPRGVQTLINTGQNRTANKFRTGRNENYQKTRHNQAIFNEFLEPVINFIPLFAKG